MFSSHTFPAKYVPVYFILCVTIMLVFAFIYWLFSFGKWMIFAYWLILWSFHLKIMIILPPPFQLLSFFLTLSLVDLTSTNAKNLYC